MKKIYLTIASLILCVGYGVLSWDIVTYSEVPNPSDSEYAGVCGVISLSENAAPKTEYDMCCIDYNEALNAVTQDWQANLKKIADQEKPASEMVEDAYESMRTYNCWMEYICSAVHYSGYGPIQSALGTGLKEEHLGTVPGCQSPDNLRMESEYNYFNTGLKDVEIIGMPIGVMEDIAEDIADGVADTFEDFYTENHINFFPRCMTDPSENNRQPSLINAGLNYDACKRSMALYFGCPDYIDKELCPEFSNAFATVENVLKKSHADQKASALESKLGVIVGKMSGMEERVNYMSNFLTQLDARFKCYAQQCD